MVYEIVQGKILTRPTAKRTCNVLQIPDHYIMRDVRLPRTLMSQSVPQIESIVLVASEGSYKSYVIAVLREPLSFVSKEGVQGLRASSDLESQQLQPGEIFMESRGDPSSPIPGAGSTFFMGNDGTITLHSGKRKESITIGGSDDDDDGEIIIQCDNGFYESNINPLTFMQSAYRFDEDNTLTLGNILTDGGIAGLEIPVCELTMDPLGNTKLRNTIFGTGTDNAVLDMNAIGAIKLKNNFSSLELSSIGDISLSNVAGSLTMSSVGATSLTTPSTIEMTGSTINFNSGTFGVARLNDTVFSSLVEDPAWWLFWSTLAPLIAALPTTPLDGGASLKAGLSALFATIPQTITSRISTASTTVKAGG